MWELLVQLAPEMLGLMATPAAVIGCLLLLGSSHPVRNVLLLAGIFLAVYALLSAVIILAVGMTPAPPSGSSSSSLRAWISLVVGLLFLFGGILSAVRGRHTDRNAGVSTEPRITDQPPTGEPDGTAVGTAPPLRAGAVGTSAPAFTSEHVAPPAWIGRLVDPSAGFVIFAALVLAIANPNIAILASALGTILTAEVSLGGVAVAVLILLLSSMIDFIVPSILFAVSGPHGRERLRSATAWLILHNHTIGVVVLVGFGLLFTGRGFGQLTG